MTRYSGKLNIRAIEDYQRVLPQLSDSQLWFLYRITSHLTKVEEQRALIMAEMAKRCADEYVGLGSFEHPKPYSDQSFIEDFKPTRRF